jgi:hypothetical protein
MGDMGLKSHAISTHHLGFLIELGHTIMGLIPTIPTVGTLNQGYHLLQHEDTAPMRRLLATRGRRLTPPHG